MFIDNGYNDWNLIHQPLLDAQAKYQITLPTGKVITTNPTELNKVKTEYEANLKALQISNKVWSKDFTADENKSSAPAVVSQLNDIFNDSKYSKLISGSEQAKLVKGVLDTYNTHVQNLANFTKEYLSSSSILVKDENNSWKAYLEKEKTSQPLLAPVINSVFSKL